MVDAVIVEQLLHTLGTYGLAVYVVLRLYIDRRVNDRTTFIGIGKIAALINCSRRQVSRELDKLVEVRLLRRISGKSEGQENVYEVFDTPYPPVAESVEGAENKEDGLDIPVAGYDSLVPGGMPTEAIGYDNDAQTIRKKENTTKKEKDSPRLFETGAEKSIHTQVVAEIDRLYELANPGVDCPWNGLAFGRLKKLLGSAPKWTAEQWLKCVRFRFQSDNIVPGDPPENFIPGLKRYVSGALSEFSRPRREAQDVKPVSRNAAARDAIIAEIDRAASQDDY